MRIPRLVMQRSWAGLMLLGAATASGQSAVPGSAAAYPNKPIRAVTAPAGGTPDLVARLIALGLSSSLGQPVVVDNRPSGVTLGEIVVKARPDGYTLLVTGSAFWMAPFLQDVPYDPLKDFSPVSLAASAPNVLVIYPGMAVKSIKDLIALAKAKPGALNYASASAGSPNHLAAELFNAMAGVSIVRVTYKGTAQALTDVMSGQVQLHFPSAGSTVQHVKAGKLRALAVTSAQPSALIPELPTVAAAGVPGYEAVSNYAVFAPAGTPAAVTTRLSQEIMKVLTSGDTKDRVANAGIETVGSTPPQLVAAMKSEMARMGKVIKDAGIRGE